MRREKQGRNWAWVYYVLLAVATWTFAWPFTAQADDETVTIRVSIDDPDAGTVTFHEDGKPSITGTHVEAEVAFGKVVSVNTTAVIPGSVPPRCLGEWSGLPPKELGYGPNVDPKLAANGWLVNQYTKDYHNIILTTGSNNPRDPVSCRDYPIVNVPMSKGKDGAGLASWGPQESVRVGKQKEQEGSESDPVLLYSGEFVQDTVDLRIRGRGLDFVWGRTYRSKQTQESCLGYQWDHSYNIYVEPAPEGKYLVHLGNGASDLFYPIDSGGFYGDRSQAELAFSNGEPCITFGDGTKWNFHGFTIPEVGKRGKLYRITDRFNNDLTLYYTAAGRLERISDTLNRDILLHYYPSGHFAAGLLQDVTDFAGRQIAYEYYDGGNSPGCLGDLRRVTYPPIVGTVTLNDFPNGRTVDYTYTKGHSQPALNHNLLTIRDGKNQLLVSNVYSTDELDPDHLYPENLQFDRVTKQYWGYGMVSFCYDLKVTPSSENNFARKRTIVKDRVGNVTEYYFRSFNNLVMKSEYTGRAPNPSLPTTATSNRPVVKLRTTDPEYFKTKYSWSTDRLDSRVDPNGNVTEFRYQSYYDPYAPVTTQNQLRKIWFLPGTHTPAGDQTAISTAIEYAADFGGCGCGRDFVSRITDGKGKSTSYGYDDIGNLTRIDYAKPGVYETFEYNSFGQMTAHVHPGNDSGHRRRDEYTYYPTGPQEGYLHTSVVDATGEALTTTYEFDAVGKVTRITDPKGGDTQYIYNSNDELIRSISPVVKNGEVLRYSRDYIYDANGNVVRTEERNYDADGQEGLLITAKFQHDILNRVTRIERSAETQDDTVSSFGYDLNGNLTQITTGEAVAGTEPWNLMGLKYDERDKLYQSKRSDRITTQFDYDLNGNLTARSAGTEETPRIDAYVYDGYDRPVKHTDPTGTFVNVGYDANGQMVSLKTTGKLGDGSTIPVRLQEASYEYDDLGRLTALNRRHFDPATQLPIGDGSSNSILEYADNGSLTKAINDSGQSINFTYDTMGRFSRFSDARGNSTSHIYDENSNIVEIRDIALGDVIDRQGLSRSTYAYDGLNRLTTATDHSGNVWQYGYDSRGNPVRFTDPLGNVTDRVLDRLGRLRDEVHHLPGGSTMTLHQTWDRNSRLRTQTDARGNVTSYTYDNRDQLSVITYADNTSETIQRNRFGDPSQVTDANGAVIVDTYDALDRLTGRTIAPAGGGGGNESETFRYNGLSRLTCASDTDSIASFAFDSLGYPLKESLTAGTQLQRDSLYTYDGSGELQSVTYPGGRVLDFQYTVLGAISTIADRGAAPLGTYLYEGNQIARLDYANGTRLDLSFNGRTCLDKNLLHAYLSLENDYGLGRPNQTLHTRVADGSVIDQRQYTWDRLQNKTKRNDLRASSLQATGVFDYDTLSRLTKSVKTFAQGRQVSQTYALDPAGNRDSVTGPLGTLWDYDLGTGSGASMNRYAETPFDARSYDANGNLTHTTVSSTVSRTATFDAYNQLLQQTVSNPVGAPQLSLLDVTGADLDGWVSQSGTWNMVDGILSGSGTAARIVRPVPVPYDRFVFSYRTAHDPAAPATFDPEYYALAVLRVDPSSTNWRYVALVIEPRGVFLREWVDDQPTELAANAEVTTAANVWDDVEVRFNGANIEVWRGERGQTKTQVLTGSTDTGLSSNLVGLGVGAGTDYRFDDVGLTPAGSRVAGAASYAYDALGRRIAKTVDGVTTYYTYTGNRVVEERGADGAVQASYVYGSYIDEVLQMRRGGQDYYYHSDDQYNVVALTDASGNVVERYDYGDFGSPEFYAPDGTPRSGSAVGNPWLFTGRQWDPELGCYYYRSRYMDPLAGTFLSRDPIGIWGDPYNLGNGNAYVGNNPWSCVDPYGAQGAPADYYVEYGTDPRSLTDPQSFRRGHMRQVLERPHSMPAEGVNILSQGANGTLPADILPAAESPMGQALHDAAATSSAVVSGPGLLNWGWGLVRGSWRWAFGAKEVATSARAIEAIADEGTLCKVVREGADDAANLADDLAPRIARITPDSLPADELERLLETLQHIDDGTVPSGPLSTKWGEPFKNLGDPKPLPGSVGPASPYQEYRVAPPLGTKGPGPNRIVVNTETGEMYYTFNHYGQYGQKPAFVQIR